jgi:hypothetical protein
MSENNSEIDQHSDEDTGPILKEKKTRGRPKVDHSNDPPKPNGRKIRSEKQKEAWSKTQAKNADKRALKKSQKEEHLAEVYMKSKEKKREQEPESETEIDIDSDSSLELTAKQLAKLEAKRAPKSNKAKPKPKSKKTIKKVVYVSSSSESDSESETESESSEEAPIVKRRDKQNKRVSIERDPQPSFDSSAYFV